ncbi:hypothetical protein GH714_019712 [Hevea brasiliensis]|uniref:Uncharacterized protein n=1 Tax=Hevea brasiliensis TaxID=3981 RepID=A0A6A6M3R0_HEVBR|nr:hypothetical protein GH714_019712 [Hevea brasiliensis]
MGLLRSLVMMLLLIWFLWLPVHGAQRPNSSHELDALLQDYAYKALAPPKTGLPYDGAVPSELNGIKIAALRLRSGSLRRKGVDMYKEFVIPLELLSSLMWRGLFWSTKIWEIGLGGIRKTYNMKFSDVKSAPDGSIAKCVWFDLQGNRNFSNVASGNECFTIQQGHFSIVVEYTAPSPAPSGEAPAPSGQAPNVPGPSEHGKNNSKVWIIVGSVLVWNIAVGAFIISSAVGA